MKINLIRNMFLTSCITILFLFTSQNVYSQIHSTTSAHTSYTGLSMTGYQGWFGTPGDGGTNSWRHYSGENGFQPGSASIEYWPDMREADEDEKYLTSYVKNDGTPCYVFSSVHPKTVSRHFRWMKEYGIDGAFMQRFRSDLSRWPTVNKILGNALNAAWEHQRAIALMYDIGANIHIDGVPNDAKRTEEVNLIFNDWKTLIDELSLTTGGDNQPYLYHNGKPLIVLWGVGFNHRHNTTGLDVQYWVELVDSLQNSPEYGGCSIMLGVPRSWRNGGSDCISGEEHTKMIELIKSVDIIQPWHTSRYRRDQMLTEFKAIVKDDIAWCKANGIDYTPTISPGIREKILHENDYEKPREGGYYFWDMARAAIDAGSEMLYLGMFDEVDEGTQYHKIDNNPPPYREDLSFATYGTDPEDHYLWLAGEATRALRGEFYMTDVMRYRANDSNFESEITFTDNGSTYEMQLTTLAAGRKIYYADPYKVPDGAPTVITYRDNSLFKNELTSEKVTFSEEQRGMYIRFVEVNETTDKVLSYKAVVATHGFAKVPYLTSFEEGKLDHQYWTTSTENNFGRIDVIGSYEPRTGNYHLAIDANDTITNSINNADLHLDINDITTDIILNFSLKTFGDETNPEDGIYFSNDAGTTFSKVFDIQITPEYTDFTLNIKDIADSAGISFSREFVIRFQYKANKSITDDGIVLDDIKVLYSDVQSGFGQYLNSDEDTQGKWIGKYGVDGKLIVGKETNIPEYADIVWDPISKTVVWDSSSTDIRGLQYSADSTTLAAQYSDSANYAWWFTVDVGEEDKNVSLYFLDGDNQNRKFILNLVDKATGDKYDSQTIQNFEDGKWLTWKIRGKVKFVFDLLEGPGAVVSGIFFGPSSPAAIEVDKFLTFDGVDDFVDCGRDSSLQISGTEITLEAWFKINAAKPATWQSTILAMDHSESGNDVGYFLRANGDGQINWGFGDGKWHEVKSEEGVQLFEIDTWNHIAGVYDGSSQSIYLNGNLVTRTDSVIAEILPAPSENLFIGSTPAFSNRVIDAGLAEVRIWNIARTASQIKEFATQRITGEEEGLAAYWPIIEGEGQTITDMSFNSNDGVLGGTPEESGSDPSWTEGTPVIKMIDVLKDYNGSFEDGLTFWRFFEVPNSLGSMAEIIQGDVIDGANAAKITFVEPDATLGDRALDNWDSNMALEPGAEYFGEFWAKADSAGSGKLALGYGFFDDNRQVLSEDGKSFTLTDIYQKYEFSFIAPEGTAKGWLAFRWKHPTENKHIPGVLYIDHVQLRTEDKTTDIEYSDSNVPDKFDLKQNYPNPFNPSTTISFSLPEISDVRLSIYNILGQRVAELVNRKMNAGSYNITWNAQNLASGIYIIAFRANSIFMTKKMNLIK